MLRANLQRAMTIAKHWGGYAGALSLVVVVMQNVFQRSEMATQDRIHQLEIAVVETQSACDLQASAIANQRKDLNTVMRIISGSSKRNVE